MPTSRHGRHRLSAPTRGLIALLVAAGIAGSGAVAATAHPSSQTTSVPSKAQRVKVTSAAYRAITDKVRRGQSLNAFGYDNFTSQYDVLDYGVNELWKKGIDGAGTTVAFVVTNPDDGLEAELNQFSKDMKLPKPDIEKLAMPVPSTPAPVCKVECSPGEDRLDAESIHMMAPYAKLLFVSPPVPETIGMQGWPELAQAVTMIADNHLADVISVSMGDHEKAFVNDPTNPGADQGAAIHSLDAAFFDAAAQRVPVLFSSGDCGPTGPTVLDDTGQCTPTMGISADHPGDNPWVTSVGGTLPNKGLATTTGRTAPDALWTGSDFSDAEGAGVSDIYPQPSWQRSIPALKGVKGRAYPDITADSDNGTSQASPTMAGILALATQLHHGRLGMINEALAKIGPRGVLAGLVDVPAGYDNSAWGVSSPYKTGTGYDQASGWGNVWAPTFVPALVDQIRKQDAGTNTPAQQARTLLTRLQSHITVRTNVTTITVNATGYIPGASPNGTEIVDGYGVFPPLRGQYGSGGSDVYADPNSTEPGTPWDKVTYALTRNGKPFAPAAQTATLTPPDGKGRVVLRINKSVLPTGRYMLRLTGRLIQHQTGFTV
jgi:hypothetical protein